MLQAIEKTCHFLIISRNDQIKNSQKLSQNQHFQNVSEIMYSKNQPNQ